MTDSIKKRTEKGNRTSALSKKTVGIGHQPLGPTIFKISPRTQIKQQHRREVRRAAEDRVNAIKAPMRQKETMIARGPNSPAQSPKKPSQPKRDKKPRSLAKQHSGARTGASKLKKKRGKK